MSSLSQLEKRIFDDLLQYEPGFILDFSNNTYAEFFRTSFSIDIYAQKYAFNGDSKAKRLRAFWEIEPDPLVGKVLGELLKVYQYERASQNKLVNESQLTAAQAAVARLTGQKTKPADTDKEFIDREYKDISFNRLNLESSLVPILESRFSEACHCLDNAPLATIFMCGSILEGLLLGLAQQNPKAFNQAKGGNKQFADWKLSEFIDVAYKLGYLDEDIKKHSHSLRDFRNYIHPHVQMHSRFAPDVETAKISMQVLKAAVVRLSTQKQ